jgi:uncharacterized protein YfaP (DUF2135 family)
VNVQNQPVTVVRNERRSETFSLTEPLGANVFRITLSWTQQKQDAVKDVDSYLSVPGTLVLVSYRAVKQNVNGAFLDRDDTDWAGPETVTIDSLVSDGEYVYYVNNYDSRSNSVALGNSEVRVRVYKGAALVKSYSVPAGHGITYEVFRIKNGEIIDTGTYNNYLFVY